MTGDLVAFLRARLDEDEQTARACDGHEAFDGTGIVPGATARGPVLAVLPSHVATHIARHDPARVLAEVDAKRRIIAEYSATIRIRDEADAKIKAAWPKPDTQDLDTWNRAQREAAIMKDWVRLLALPYREHPDYQPEWAPEA